MATNKRFLAKNGVDNNNNTLSNVSDPVNAQDASTKAFSSNASNLTSGTVDNARLPSTITATITGNASTATALQTSRTLWGQTFDGTANVTGSLTSVGSNITGSGALTLTATAGTLTLDATGANVLSLATNSSERLRIDATGNVGIGTSDPSTYTTAGKVLVVVSTAPSLSNGGIVNYDASTMAQDVGGVLTLGGNDGVVNNRAFAALKGGKENATSGNYASYAAIATRANGGSLTERLRIDSSGNVGIGVSGPTARLDALSSTSSVSRFTSSSGGTSQSFFRNAGVYTVSQAYQFDFEFSDGVSFFSGAAINAYRASNSKATHLSFSTTPDAGSATERMRISANGRVLIGTATDDGNNRLQVSGSLAVGDSNVTNAGVLISRFNSSVLARMHSLIPSTNSPNYQQLFGGTWTGERAGSTDAAHAYYMVAAPGGVQFEIGRVGTSGAFTTSNMTPAIVIKGVNDYVGIGTTSPDGKLHLSGTAAAPAALIFERSDGGVGAKNWFQRIRSNHTFDIGKTDDSGTVTNTYFSIDTNGAVDVPGTLTVGGNLTVNGTTTTVNSTTVTIDDPIFTLGGDTAPGTDDNKDRGIEFRWHNGTSAKVGFFGFDDSTGYLTFIPDATNTSEVFSGSLGDIQAANFRGALVGNASTSTTLQTARTLWGQSFNGSTNITGSLTSVGDITGTGAVALTATAGTLNLAATGANIITASTNGSERMRIDSSGNVGIGVSAPYQSSVLDVYRIGAEAYSSSGATAFPFSAGVSPVLTISNISSTDGAAAYLLFRTANAASSANLSYIAGVSTPGSVSSATVFGQRTSTGYNERMRIDALGHLVVGQTSSDPWSLGLTRHLLVGVGSDTVASASLSIQAGTTGNARIDMGNATILRSGIRAIDGSHLTFLTNGTNAGTTLTERMRVLSNGNVLIGTSTDNGSKVQIVGNHDVTSIGGTSTLDLLGGDTNNDFCNFSMSTSASGRIVTLGAKATTTGAYPNVVGELHIGVQNGASTTTTAVFTGSGNVLIGSTTQPSGVRLYVNGGTQRITQSGGAYVFVEDSAVTDGNRPFGYIANVGGVVSIGNANRSGTATTGSANRINIATDGKVAIGATADTAQLKVTSSNVSVPVELLNGTYVYAWSGNKAGSTAVNITLTANSYFVGKVMFMYCHTNGGNAESAFAEGYFTYNSSTTAWIETVSNNLTTTGAGSITFTTNATNKTLVINLPTGNASNGFYTVKVESATALANLTIV